MKHILTFLFLSFLYQIQAQVWVNQGAVWHYNYTGIGDGGFIKLEYNSDTLIEGISCQKIEYTKSHFGTDQNGDIFLLGITNGLGGITYSNGDTVFYRRNNRFYTLYNFGAQIGDSWIIDTLSDNSDLNCGDTSRVVVTDVGIINMNGTDYRYITLETVTGSPYQLSGRFVERFGPSGSGYLGHTLFPYINTCDPNVFADYYIYSFKCFQDNSFALYNPSGGNCEYVVGLSNIIQNNDIKIYPNPVQNEFTIEIENQTNLNLVQITSVLGEIVGVYEVKNSQTKIDLSSVKNGIYLVSLLSENAIIKTFKIVKK